MGLSRIIISIAILTVAEGLIISNDVINNSLVINNIPDNVFNGVYTECFLHLSYSCLQKKTLLYLKELNTLSEVSVIGDFVKFVRINATSQATEDEDSMNGNTEELAFRINKAIDNFFDSHVLKFNAMGRNISLPGNVEEFVGRKKRRGGGGGGGGHGSDDGGKKKMMMMAMMCMKMKLMMMVPAMMGMMGMMSFKAMMFSMMSFMMSKMMLLMKILEKKGGGGGSGGSGGGDGGWAVSGGGGGAWMPAGPHEYVGGGGGYDSNGQWQSRSIVEKETQDPILPFDRQTMDMKPEFMIEEDKLLKSSDILPSPLTIHNIRHENERKNLKQNILDTNEKNKNTFKITYIKPAVRYQNKAESEVYKKPVLIYKKSNVNFKINDNEYSNSIGSTNFNEKDDKSATDDYFISHFRSKRDITNAPSNAINLNNDNINTSKKFKQFNVKSRQKRGILDIIQNSYLYWMNTLLGLNNNRRTNLQRYKIVNGVKYVYYPYKVSKPKTPREMQLSSTIKIADENKNPTIITAEDFNKGEIMEGGVIESRMNKKKFHKMKDTVNDTVEDNPWE